MIASDNDILRCFYNSILFKTFGTPFQ
uniref:Uncharacterized protein n=1 Tax=Anguilla anguilla TaxID=7936 RepID=A0A0E9PH22_ANGAN